MVDEVDIGRVAAGQDVSITVDALPDRVLIGRVKRISPKGRLERTVTVFDVAIDILGNNSDVLRPGMSANAEIVTDSVKGALLVLSEAIRKKGDETGVYVQGEEEPVWVKVTPGKTDGVFTEVVEGLKAGDVVILSMVKEEDDSTLSKKTRFLLYHGRKRK
jgi:HlyD family secretion protein